MTEITKHPIWTGFATGVVTFILTAVATIFILGRQVGDLRSKLNDLAAWKAEAAPQIQRMDRSGSLSFDNFKQHYDQEQAKQYKRLETLETDVRHIQTIELRLDRIERRIDDGKPRQE